MTIVGWLALFGGALLIYAGFTGESLVAALRSILSGGDGGQGGGGQGRVQAQ